MVSFERIQAALLKMAMLVEHDPAFTPVFERLEAELEHARTANVSRTSAQERAAKLLAQNARGRSDSAKCSSEAPLP